MYIYIYIYFHRLYRYLVWRLFVEVVMIMSLNPNENVSNVVYLYIDIFPKVAFKIWIILMVQWVEIPKLMVKLYRIIRLKLVYIVYILIYHSTDILYIQYFNPLIYFIYIVSFVYLVYHDYHCVIVDLICLIMKNVIFIFCYILIQSYFQSFVSILIILNVLILSTNILNMKYIN